MAEELQTWSRELGTAIDRIATGIDPKSGRQIEGYIENRVIDDLDRIVSALRLVKTGLDDVAREAERARAEADHHDK